jgi:hypothetical protein
MKTRRKLRAANVRKFELDENIKKFFPRTSRMGISLPTQWGDSNSAFLRKPSVKKSKIPPPIPASAPL